MVYLFCVQKVIFHEINQVEFHNRAIGCCSDAWESFNWIFMLNIPLGRFNVNEKAWISAVLFSVIESFNLESFKNLLKVKKFKFEEILEKSL